MNARKIAEMIYDDLIGRSGFDLDIDDDTLEDIMVAWTEIIENETK